MFKVKVLTGLVCVTFLAVIIQGCSNDTPVNPAASTDIDYNAAYVVNGEGNSISVIDIATNQVKKTISLGSMMWPHHINLNAAKTKIAIGIPGIDLSGAHGIHGEHEGMFAVLDAKTGNILGSKSLANINHNAIFSADGSEIWTAVAHTLGMVYVYNSDNLTLKDSIAVGNNPLEVTLSSDGSMVFVANNLSNNVTAINVASKTTMATIPVGVSPIAAWTGSDNKMYVDNESGQTLSIIDVVSMLVEETVSLGFKPGMAAYNSHLNELWVTNETNGTVVYFQRMGSVWMNMGSIATGNGAHALTFSNNGMTAYVTNQFNGNVSVLNTTAKTKITDIPVGIKPNGLMLRYIN
ncbi:MAG: YncE family protein [Ignavibacteria bacterium]|nr:YncE family protein [Ignavibacteria bacterium]